jgi:hypothetical protein
VLRNLVQPPNALSAYNVREKVENESMKVFAKLCMIGILAFAVLQFVRPSIPVRRGTAELQVPPAVKSILEKDCYSCHSSQRRLAWFDQIVPAYWLVRYDVLAARQRLNFSTLGSKPAAAQKATLFEAVNMIPLGRCRCRGSLLCIRTQE